MKENKFERYIILLAAVSALVCIAYFAGRSSGRHNVVIETSETAQSELQALTDDTAEAEPVSSALPAASEDKININTAGIYELSSLPGIGEVLAGRIIDYRTKYGDFKSVEEIMNVSGIGETKFDAIRDYITF